MIRILAASSIFFVANGIVTKLHGKYSLNEQFFDIWINRNYGNGGLSME
nr:hypothetical protein [uncultured Prevotella sp.]